MRQFVASTWFSPGMMKGCIGVVVTYDTDTKEYSAHIGMADGIDKIEDEMKIADWGSTFPMLAAQALFPEHKLT